MGLVHLYYGFGRICAIATAFCLAGCGITPASGPSSFDVSRAPPDGLSSYGFVKLTHEVVVNLARYSLTISNVFIDRRPPRVFQFGVGDIVSVTIFESAAGGLFIPAEASVRPGNFITLPNQAVDSNGNISVPYAGPIHAQGRTQVQVQQSIIDALKNRAIEPQTVVSLVDQRTSLITVTGEVNRPSVLPATAAGERLLDAITRAGGPRAAGFDTWVMLERGGHRATASFSALAYQTSNNIYVHPGDTIYVYSEPQTFVAFGAAGIQGQYKFDAWRISLAEAVAKAHGLKDEQADPAAVFLYRGETREVAERLGIDCSKFSGPIIPVIYNVNFRDPAGYFLATNFEIRNKDIIYTSNAISVDSVRFLNYLRTIMATVDDPIIYATNYYGLLRAIKGTSSSVIVNAPISAGP